MAAKFFHPLTDDVADFQKQMGCMTGIFQLFDRQHIITSRRRITGSISKGNDSSPWQPKPASLEKCSSKNINRNSVGSSSRASFSSSCSSSFSSIDYSRASQLESISFDRMILSEIPNRESGFGHPSPVIRNFVKDSMYRELQGSRDGVQCKTEGLFRSSSYRSKDASLFSITRDAPRLSYDGRRALCDSFDSSKSSCTLKEIQRQSSDTRQVSKNSDVGKVVQSQQASSIIAKLMGLETLPNPVSSTDSTVGSFRSHVEDDSSEKASSLHSLYSVEEPNSLQWRRNSESSMKPATRFPVELGPWKHNDAVKSSKKPDSKEKQCPAILSVYSEIDKRLEDLEFLQSGKDLRALKQVLGTMQAKAVPETVKQGQSSGFFTEKNLNQKNNRKLIMKPAKYVEKYGMLSSSRIPFDNQKQVSRERTSSEQSNAGNAESIKGGIRTFKATETSVKCHHLAKEGDPGFAKTSGSISFRVLHRKAELESSSRPRSQSNRQQSDLSSPSRRRRVNDDQKRGTDTESTSLSCTEVEEDQANKTMILSNAALRTPETSPRISTPCSPHAKSSEKESALTSSEEESAESSSVPTEFSSPVSVLDHELHRPDTSPVRLVSKTVRASDFNRKKLQNIENLVLKLRKVNSSHDESRTDYIALLCQNSDPDHRYVSEILLASGLLLRDLTDFHFHPSGYPINPELFLVLEQTRGSILSNGPCGATKSVTSEKTHRKFIFDAVNEILASKLSSASPHCQPPLGFAAKTITPQMLLRDLCSEIDTLRTKRLRHKVTDAGDEELRSLVALDMMRHPSGSCHKSEISGAVLDIERMLFKDLVNEIVVGVPR